MGPIERLMTLLHWLRRPHEKPPVTAAADARLDAAEERLERLADGYRRGHAAMRGR